MQLLPLQQYLHLERQFPLRWFFSIDSYLLFLIFWNRRNYNSRYTTQWSTPIKKFIDINFLFCLCHWWNTTSWSSGTFLLVVFYWLFSFTINFLALQKPPWTLYPLENSPHLSHNSCFCFFSAVATDIAEISQAGGGHFPHLLFFIIFNQTSLFLFFWHFSNWHGRCKTWWRTPIIFLRAIILLSCHCGCRRNFSCGYNTSPRRREYIFFIESFRRLQSVIPFP